MHQFATGTSGSDLLDCGHPLSPETIGRAPSNAGRHLRPAAIVSVDVLLAD